MSYHGFKPYVSVAKRRAKALREMNKLKKKGKEIIPIEIEKLKITLQEKLQQVESSNEKRL